MARLSLRFLLLRRLLPAMAGLLAAGAATAYWVAHRSATTAYDRSLLDTALAIVDQLSIVDGKPTLRLTPQARAVLLTDKFDQIFFAVRGPNNELFGGEPGLPLPVGDALESLRTEGRHYYNGTLGGNPLRLAALQAERGGQPVTIVAAETLVKRTALQREIIVGMLLPELLLVLATFMVAWFGIRSGLQPLAGLQRELAGRSHADLSPIATAVPDELQPVVDEINELMGRLEHSLDSQRHFVSDAAHQLRTPIAALQAQVEAALGDASRHNRTQLEGVLAAAHRLSHLVDQLLALARAEPSQPQPLPEIFLENVVHGVAENWLPAAIEKGIDLGFDLQPTVVRGNNFLLQEMLANLVDNALRHTPAGGAVTVACAPKDDGAVLAIDDSGPGIAADEREKVFERFYQSPDSLSDGCGLGLAIVLKIVRQHGGDASIGESPTLGGTRVEISLPAESSSEPD
ncbi:MAG: ATP-binding region, ATPase-like:Histidine kinase, region:Histidine kinase N-terminal [Rhodocyclaceae bacterium]|nr:ATP-binding region, ATPase-like:Histidine kinase, region:Histidine kinase N-terminal [Rhodocyclaceae bacterium]